MKKITLNLFVMLLACCFWQVSGQTFNGADTPSAVFGGSSGDQVTSAAAVSVPVTPVVGTNPGDFNIESVTLDITHSFAGDLEIVLISPDGTEVALTTDNGSGNDLVAGTPFVFTDASANEATDYDSGDPLESDYRAEGGGSTHPVGFGDGPGVDMNTEFAGEMVNGDWTVRLYDDAGGDPGVLNSYMITFAEVTLPAPSGPLCVGAVTTLDGAPGTVTEVTLTIDAADGVIGAGMTDMLTLDNVLLDELTYNQVEELSVTLTSPAGTTITLFANDGGNSADGTPRDLVFTDDSANDVDDWDDAATFMADFMAEGGSLNDTFDGESIFGDWILTITNGGSNGGGTLDDFCLEFTENGTVGNVPTIECPMDITADNDEDACGAIVNFADAIALDLEDGPITATQVADGAPASGEEFPVGTTTVTFEATDSNGNTVMCSFDVTVVDATDPVLECPDAILVANGPGLCEAAVTVPAPTITDNCEASQPGTLVNDYNGTDDASDVYPVGTTIVEFTYTDAGGLTATCTVEVTVEDTEAPEVLCEGQDDDTASGSAAPAAPIISNDPAVISTITITDSQIITDANVDININHTWVSDLDIELTSPAGTSVLIFDGGADGCSSDDIVLTFDDESANALSSGCQGGLDDPAFTEADYMPSNALSAFDGEDTAGDWTISVVDGVGGDDGTFNSWSLNLMYDPITLPPLVVELDADGNGSVLPADLVVSATDNCGSVTVSAGGITTEGGCDLDGDLDASDDTWDRPIAG